MDVFEFLVKIHEHEDKLRLHTGQLADSLFIHPVSLLEFEASVEHQFRELHPAHKGSVVAEVFCKRVYPDSRILIDEVLLTTSEEAMAYLREGNTPL